MRKKKGICTILAIIFIASTLIFGRDIIARSQASYATQAGRTTGGGVVQKTAAAPKYIFLFIGDGMSFPQIASSGIYSGTVNNCFRGTAAKPTPNNAPSAEMPSFTAFPVAGAATTHDASKFVTDSASAATAIACGEKTLDGMLGVDPYNKRIPAISEILKQELGYKIGIITSVSLNHATPAGFYAHVPSRGSYYDIGLELIASNFDFFGGGSLRQARGVSKDREDLTELAKKAGYKVVNTYEEIRALGRGSGKTIAINPVLDNSSDVALSYMIDRGAGDFGLDAYVQKAVDVFGTDPFFIMAEGGKIDWSCHANDAYTTIKEVKDLEAAVRGATNFASKHPGETLIIVTGDHETGGFTMGYNGTQYNTFLYLLQDQKLSFKAYADNYVNKYRANNTSFGEAMKDVKELFGLIMPDSPEAKSINDKSLVLTEKEVEQLRKAYTISMIPYHKRNRDKEYKTVYTMNDNEPFQIVITHILNSRAGLGWTTTAHTGLLVAVFAYGAGAETFSGFYDNTDISKKIKELVGLPY